MPPGARHAGAPSCRWGRDELETAIWGPSGIQGACLRSQQPVRQRKNRAEGGEEPRETGRRPGRRASGRASAARNTAAHASRLSPAAAGGERQRAAGCWLRARQQLSFQAAGKGGRMGGPFSARLQSAGQPFPNRLQGKAASASCTQQCALAPLLQAPPIGPAGSGHSHARSRTRCASKQLLPAGGRPPPARSSLARRQLAAVLRPFSSRTHRCAYRARAGRVLRATLAGPLGARMHRGPAPDRRRLSASRRGRVP